MHVYRNLLNRNTNKPTQRIKSYTEQKMSVCREVWLFCNYCDKDLYMKLSMHYNEHGLQVRPHASAGKVPTNRKNISVEDIHAVVNFLDILSNRFGTPNPASNKIFLQSNITRKKAAKMFNSGYHKTVSHSTFQKVWKMYRPNVQRMTPRCDVCADCEVFRDKLKTANFSSGLDNRPDIQTIMTEFDKHLKLAEVCRGLYVKWQEEQSEEILFLSIDFAQNVNLPSYTRQVGPLYYLVPYRVNVLGILDEHHKKQYNFLIGEGSTPGFDNSESHNANVILTSLDKLLSLDQLQLKSILRIQMDNCSGQNKNRYTIWYLVNLLMNSPQLQSIEIGFMLTGHTRCAVDANFGSFKKTYRTHDASTLTDLGSLVTRSSEVNMVEYSTGDWMDWKGFVNDNHLHAISGISKYHYFHLTRSFDGQVSIKAKERIDGSFCPINLKVPRTIRNVKHFRAKGLTLNRFNYLVLQVLPHVRETRQKEYTEMLSNDLNMYKCHVLLDKIVQ